MSILTGIGSSSIEWRETGEETSDEPPTFGCGIADTLHHCTPYA